MMGRLTLLWMLGVGLPTAPPQEPELKRFQFDRVEMAVPFQLVLYAPDSASANESAEAAFARIRQLNAHLQRLRPRERDAAAVRYRRRGEIRARQRGTLGGDCAEPVEFSTAFGGAFDVTVGPGCASFGGGPGVRRSCLIRPSSPRPGNWSATS